MRQVKEVNIRNPLKNYGNAKKTL